MDSGTLALLLVGAMAVWLAAWMWACWARAQACRGAMTALEGRVEHLEKMQRILLAGDEGRTKWLRENEMRIAGVEALLVSTVGQETEDFCRSMDKLMERMEKPEEKKEPAQEGPKLVLSEKYCGVFKAPKPDKRRGGKKGAGRG